MEYMHHRKKDYSYSVIKELLHAIADKPALMSYSAQEMCDEAIGELALGNLFEPDKAAYTRFAPVHGQFGNVEESMKVVRIVSDSPRLKDASF